MKNQLRVLVTLVLCLGLVSVYAQFGPPRAGMGGGPGAPSFSGSMAKLFGDNSAFTAKLEVQTQGSRNSSGEAMTMPGQIAFADGKSSFEMDMT